MSDNPTEPGPVLETYDPHWEARFNAAKTMLKILWERADPLGDHDLAVQLTKELTDAHEARYKYLWQYHAAVRERVSLLPLSIDPTLHVPLPPPTATRAQMLAHYANWRKNWEYRRFVVHLPPAVEWETGVFARTPPQGVTPIVDEAIIEMPHMTMPVRMTLVVEHHPGTTHVCAVQGPQDVASVTNNEEGVMDYIAARYLPRPGLLSRLVRRLKGEPTPRLMFYYTYTPRPYRSSQQHVWGHELRWVGWGVVKDCRATRSRPHTPRPFCATCRWRLLPRRGSA